MTAELIGILTVGVALAALHVTTLRGLRTDLRDDARAIRGELDRARDELRSDIRALDDRMRTQERSTAKLDGLLEGRREAVVVRAGPRSGAAEATGGYEQALLARVGSPVLTAASPLLLPNRPPSTRRSGCRHRADSAVCLRSSSPCCPPGEVSAQRHRGDDLFPVDPSGSARRRRVSAGINPAKAAQPCHRRWQAPEQEEPAVPTSPPVPGYAVVDLQRFGQHLQVRGCLPRPQPADRAAPPRTRTWPDRHAPRCTADV